MTEDDAAIFDEEITHIDRQTGKISNDNSSEDLNAEKILIHHI